MDLREDLQRVFGRVPVAPRRGRVHRVMRIGEAHPTEERTVDAVQPLDRAVGDPRRRMIFLGERVAPGLRVVPHRAGGFGLHEPQSLDAALETVAEHVPGVVQTEGRRPEDPVPPSHQIGDAQIVAEQHELRVLEAEVGAVPFGIDARRTVDRLDASRRKERESGSEVRLADDRGAVSGSPEEGRDRTLLGVGRQIDAVARDAVRRRIRAGQDRRARRLAKGVLRARSGVTRSSRRESVEPRRRLQWAALDAERVGALLVGRDEQYVHAPAHRRWTTRGDAP